LTKVDTHERANCNQPAILVDLVAIAGRCALADQAPESIGRGEPAGPFLSVTLAGQLGFGGIDGEQANALARDLQSVPVDHGGCP
jgi:hypothetical protein